MKTKKIITKEVGFAYATSSTAINLGFGASGCWFVVINGDGPPDYRKAFDATDAGKISAFDYADKLPYEYNAYSVKR